VSKQSIYQGLETLNIQAEIEPNNEEKGGTLDIQKHELQNTAIWNRGGPVEGKRREGEITQTMIFILAFIRRAFYLRVKALSYPPLVTIKCRGRGKGGSVGILREVVRKNCLFGGRGGEGKFTY